MFLDSSGWQMKHVRSSHPNSYSIISIKPLVKPSIQETGQWELLVL